MMRRCPFDDQAGAMWLEKWPNAFGQPTGSGVTQTRLALKCW